jgi:hypothetical protein
VTVAKLWPRSSMCGQIRIPESRESGGKQPNVRTRHGCKYREPYERAAHPRGVQEVIYTPTDPDVARVRGLST